MRLILLLGQKIHLCQLSLVCVAGEGQRLSSGTEHAQALTSEEGPNGKANSDYQGPSARSSLQREFCVLVFTLSCSGCQAWHLFSDTPSKVLENKYGQSVHELEIWEICA